jgi:thioredoxin reductase (NADPH)
MPPALTTPAVETDCLVIGAGPAALFLIFELGLLEISCHVIDVLAFPGGQCMALYADKPIYDIPGTPRTTGRELTQSLLTQIAPFHPQFHLGEQLTELARHNDTQWLAETSTGQKFVCKTVVIAAGVGAFMPRKLAHVDLQAYEGSQVFYAAHEHVSHKHIVINGAGDEAIEAALACLAFAPSSISLVHRRDKLDASDELQTAFEQAVTAGRINFKVGQVQALSPEGVSLATPSDLTQHLPCDELWVLQGLTPQLGPVASWGMDMHKKQLKVNTENFMTSEPGIFAIGDVNTYAGKRKLIVSGFHEATLAAYGVAALVYPNQKIALEYTTASPRLHKLLGVSPSAS